MIIRLVAMAAATIVISACTAQVAATDGYIYPDGAAAASSVGFSNEPTKHDLAAMTRARGITGIFGTQTSASPGIWLFPPNSLGAN
jgi:hypothetical protein